MKIIVTGAAGMLGRAVVAHCTTAGDTITAFDHATLDIANEIELNVAFEQAEPDVLINCAAWTDVDGCESDPVRARVTNAQGPELLAKACCRFGTQLITISTDYVFDGEKDGFYTQRDQPNPQSIYGNSKLEGERRAQATWARTIVVRSGYIFGTGGKNFLSTLIDRARQGQKLRAISDSLGTPTYAPHLAQGLYRLAQTDLPGIYHVVNSGDGTSFAGFARFALAVAGLDQDLVEDISLASLIRPAQRPRNSRLRCVLSPALGLAPLPSWQDAAGQFLETPSNMRPSRRPFQ